MVAAWLSADPASPLRHHRLPVLSKTLRGMSAETGAFSVPALNWLDVSASLGGRQPLLCWSQ